jgi:pimeloyl-ACP methyl ester carboxylesterase
MTQQTAQPIAGVAAGAPFVAVPPAGGPRAGAPVVVGWHLLDAPRTETALAAALPLEDLAAWRVYLGLPMSGSRMPAGGFDELMRLGYEDALLNIHKPVVEGATEEFEPALEELRERVGLGSGPVGLVGGSIGAAVALQVMATTDLDVRAAVLISPVTRMTSAVEAGERIFGVAYPWSKESRRFAERLDFVARASEIARHQADVLAVVGAEDDPAHRASAQEFVAALAGSTRSELQVVAGMGHALAEEPGVEPAPQTPQARAVDRLAVGWFQRALVFGR